MRIIDWSSDVCSSDLARRTRPQLVVADLQSVAAPVRDERHLATESFGQACTIALDRQAGRAVVGPLGRDGDDRRIIFLVAPLDEKIVRDAARRAGGQVDHIIGRAALRVVEAVVHDGNPSRARLQIMASAALFETAVRHRHLTIDTGIDAVRATQAAVATTEAREGRAVDTQRRTGIVGGQYALLAPPEQAVDDLKIAAFEADGRAIAVGPAHSLEAESVTARAIAAPPQCRLAYAGAAIPDRPAGLGSDEGDASRRLHRAVPVIAGCDADRPLPVADRVDGILQAGEAGMRKAGRLSAEILDEIGRAHV